MESRVMEIGARKQVFLDRRFIEQSEGIQINVNPPQERREVLRGDRPWDRGWIGYLTVLEDEGLYKIWYIATPESTVEEVDSGQAFRLCYAVSEDGIHWEKPELGLIEYEGGRRNNLIDFPRGNIAGTVFLDPKAPSTSRYKAVTVQNGPEGRGLYIASSPDGLHWTLHPKQVFPFTPDTQNQVIYDPERDRYIAYLRGNNRRPLLVGEQVDYFIRRRVLRVEIKDLFQPWPYTPLEHPMPAGEDAFYPSDELPVAFETDELDPPQTDIYNPTVCRYPWAQDAWYAFPSVYRHFPEEPWGPCSNDGLLDIQVAVSRDGARFYRPDRCAYIPLGIQGTGHAGQMYMGSEVVRKGDRMFQYYVAFDVSHSGYRGPEPVPIVDMSRVYVAVQWLDRFVGAEAPYTGGWLITPPLRFAGQGLEMNVDCGATGDARVALCDESGLPFPGFEPEACDPVRGNHLRKRISWQGKADVSSLADRPVRLHIRMRNARLYAFQFVE